MKSADDIRAFLVSLTVSLYSGAKSRRFGRGRPDHDPDPDQRELQAPPGETGVAELEGEVGGVEVAVQEREEREAKERDHQQGAGQIVERNGDPRAEDVEDHRRRGSSRWRSGAGARRAPLPVEK